MRVQSGITFAVLPEWLLESDVSHVAIRLYCLMDRMAQTDSGHVERSRRQLAAKMGCSRDTIDRALRELEECSALRVERRTTAAGDADSNLYILQPGGHDMRQGGRTDAATGGRTDAETVAAPMRHQEQESSSLTKAKPQVSLSTSQVAVFERFWSACPKKVGKGAARRAWQKRISAGADPEVLIAGMQRYAEWVVEAAQVGEIESMKFVVHPSTWLNGERESDHLTTPGRAPAAMSKVDRARAEHARRYGPRAV